MSVIKLKDNLYSVGVLNPGLRVFDIIMESKYGTSYNAFLLTGKKNILIDTVHESFFDEYLQNIESIVSVSKIDCLIMNHTEPDHSGSVAKLLALNPDLTVYCSMAAKKFLTGIVNHDFKCIVVKQGDKVEWDEQALEFIVAPMLHWPDSIFTWAPSLKTLFTCDFLGCHYCEPTMLDTTVHYPDKYRGEFEYYFCGIFGPFKSYVLAGLDKMRGLPVEMVCPSHGPCLTESIAECEELYRTWSEPEKSEKKVVGIFFASAYGYTKLLAETAADELSKNPLLDVKLVDIVFTPFDQVASLINRCDAVLAGSCTINRDAPKIVWDMLSCVDAVNTRSKPAGAFGSYGWTGEAVPMMKSRLEHLKFKFIGDGLRVNFRPNEDDLAAVRKYAAEVSANIR